MLRLLFLLVLTHAAFALEIRQTRWGYDGKVMPNRFNLLSVLVAQEGGGRPFEGELVLGDSRGGPQTFGAPYVQPLYLSPGTQRWVQFVSFIGAEGEWRLTWGKGDKTSAVVPAAKFGPPATVLLLDPASVFAPNARLAAFPDDLFPTSVAATDALDQLVLDHTPRWDAVRREAFLDWLRRGGTVHLLRGPDGHPRFDGELAVLNLAEKSTRVGAGRVVRHDADREQCDEAFLKAAGCAPREFAKQDGSKGAPVLYRFDQTLLQNLASLTKPEVQWWLLYLLTLAYLALIGPGHYFWSRTVDWRVAIGGFLGTVAVFALAFLVSGHRGSGEKQTSHALAIAHSLGGDRWDVQEWVSAFATKGDFYKLTHAAPANFYAVPSDMEQVPARIFAGKDGHIDADIPLYSARPFLHRGVMSGPSAEVKVVEWKPTRIALDVPTTWRSSLLRGRFLGKLITFQFHAANGLVVWDSAASATEDFVNQNTLTALQQFVWNQRSFDPKAALNPLLAHALGDVAALPHALAPRPLAPDHLQLFLFAEAPDSFAMKGKGFDRGRGHVLYVIDLFRPAGHE